jgi:CDP-diglyceride synthetase
MKNKDISNKNELRGLSIKFILGFPIVGCFWMTVIWYFSGSSEVDFRIAYWIGGIGIFLGLVTVLSYKAACLIMRFWKGLIVVIDTVIVWTVLPLFFIIILTPFSFVLRLFRKSTMSGRQEDAETFWKTCEKPSKVEQYLRQF